MWSGIPHAQSRFKISPFNSILLGRLRENIIVQINVQLGVGLIMAYIKIKQITHAEHAHAI